ncbi:MULTISPECIES: thioredoxin-dependent thiol peroxidase [unclassified Methylophaga]|jgi:peroxiredoxin Q/BCP|uniref:thioredoxin-dependent thiol peroxidase n=1 Tax=unclassified Methylophaga TaxID=2629249 RepID=UPI000C8BCE45|nr:MULTISPECIES: thioredoxin-dependent thiol peroxidase [unclassified Methylophaga]MAK67598.1 thioredoxin-dependent thiol peroxidase [Methylophaga sp.]MAY18832.1 thioredoxin-dependent thiol peroxidase [Methylophaga sp.]MBN47819.1 thioredoxin-dependent thiol peroxidase [Methylophaga sp.]HCD04684.1 thioredoxin-dependent thiol peroxidase [Methylophaga sp.]|tara:strand:- start:15284 stop:15751 length:468 start_codon:yes stop_codon:yes gene_type:complete
MTTVNLQQTVPDFELPSTGDKTIRLSDLRGNNVLIYFYPKDNTPGCTLEGQNFRDHIETFNAHNTLIFGISRDSVRVHENFREKQQFPFDLLSDADETVCNLFGVMQLKKNYGREYMGIVRSTFLIDTEGKLINEWRNVKVKQHIDEVLDVIKTL